MTAVNTLIRLSQSNQTTINNNASNIQQLKDCACGDSYSLGTLHTGLTGEGSFAIAGDLGVLLTITTDVPSASDQVGNPPYLWNRGWLSVSDANGMLDEKRLTREAQIWFPRGMAVATSFAWWLTPGLTLDVTELVPPPRPGALVFTDEQVRQQLLEEG